MRLPEIAVVDTHALLWWLSGDAKRLGRYARRFMERVDGGSAVVCIATLTLVEISEAVQRGRVRLPESFGAFVDLLEAAPSRHRIVPLTPAIVRRSHSLFAIPERADRLIAATAAELGLPVVTRDPDIAGTASLKLVW